MKDDFTWYNMMVQYGDGYNVPVIDLSEVTSITIDGMATNLDPRDRMTITASVDTLKTEGEYDVVINFTTLDTVTLPNIKFELIEGALVATLSDDDFDYYVVEVNVDGLVEKESIYKVLLGDGIEPTLVRDNTYCLQNQSFDSPPTTYSVKVYLNDKTVEDNVPVSPDNRHVRGTYYVSTGSPVESVINVLIKESLELQMIKPDAVTGVGVMIDNQTSSCKLMEGKWYLSTPMQGQASLLVYFDNNERHVTTVAKPVNHTDPLDWTLKDDDINLNQGPINVDLSAIMDDYHLTKIHFIQDAKSVYYIDVTSSVATIDKDSVKQMIDKPLCIIGFVEGEAVVECTNASISIDDATSTQTLVVSKEQGWDICPYTPQLAE